MNNPLEFWGVLVGVSAITASLASLYAMYRGDQYEKHIQAMIEAFYDLERSIIKRMFAEGKFDYFFNTEAPGRNVGNMLSRKYALNKSLANRHMLRLMFGMDPWKIYPPTISYMAKKKLGCDERWHRSKKDKMRVYRFKDVKAGRWLPYRIGGRVVKMGYSAQLDRNSARRMFVQASAGRRVFPMDIT